MQIKDMCPLKSIYLQGKRKKTGWRGANNSKAESTETYRGWNKNKERISPQAPKSNKAGIWTQIPKQEVKCQWHHYCITIDWTCCQIDVADIKAPRSSAITVFIHEVGGTISKRSKHKYQCGGDPDKPISKISGGKSPNVRWSYEITVVVVIQPSDQNPERKPKRNVIIRLSKGSDIS